MTIHEPATFFTDLALAALGTWLAFRLGKTAALGKARRWWILAIGLMAASAFAGGCYHGFASGFPAIEPWWWRLVLWIICGLGLAMGMSLLHELRPGGDAGRWRVLLVAKFAISCAVVWFKAEFLVAMIDYGSAMLAWALAALVVRRPWSGPILAGVGLSLIAAVVQQAQWGLSRHFNHNDVFHGIQALALVAFYRGGLKLGPGSHHPIGRAGIPGECA